MVGLHWIGFRSFPCILHMDSFIPCLLDVSFLAFVSKGLERVLRLFIQTVNR